MRKVEPMPTLTGLLADGLRPANDRDALEFAAKEDPEAAELRDLLRLRQRLDRDGVSLESYLADQKRQQRLQQTST